MDFGEKERRLGLYIHVIDAEMGFDFKNAPCYILHID